jgi:parallel beta-helix repeat protein
MRYLAVTLAVVLLAPTVWAKSFQQAYDEAGPGEGYDKQSCIRGNGALVDLDNSQIYVSQPGTEALITGCCLINGTNGDAAIAVQDGAKATIDGNTICKNGLDGIKVWLDSSATIKNNIIFGSARYGIAAYQTSYPSCSILYNDIDRTSGNYMYWCPG